jgi:hypothetical protein
MRKIALAFYINPYSGALQSPPAADLDEARQGLESVPYPEETKKSLWDLFDRAESNPGIFQFLEMPRPRNGSKYPLLSAICVLEFPDQTKPTEEDLQNDPTAPLRELLRQLTGLGRFDSGLN